jgi:DivIVA protein
VPPPFALPAFRPKRALFGYERKATDTFLAQVAEVLGKAHEQLERGENELAEHREKERSLNEVLLQIAKVSDAVKADARLEEKAIRDRARDLEQIVTATRSELGSFLRETLEKLDRLAAEMDHGSWADRLNYDEKLDPRTLVGDLTLGGLDEPAVDLPQTEVIPPSSPLPPV